MPEPGELKPVDNMEAMFLTEATASLQKLLAEHQGVFQLALVVNWRNGIDDTNRTHCILEGTPHPSVSDDPVQLGMKMYELLLSSGSTMMRQLLGHSVSQLHKAGEENKRLKNTIADLTAERDKLEERQQ